MSDDAETTPCTSCGMLHRSIYSHELLETYGQWKSEPDEDVRRALMTDLAAIFAADNDGTNCDLSEIAHDLLDEYHQTQLKAHQITLRLARMIITGVQVEALETAVSAKKPDKSPSTGNVN
jgi:hypothetical protein